MFKKSLLALSLVALSGTALSAPVANLKVQGTITPPSCTINGATETTDVQYTFDVAPGLFPASGNLTLDEQSKNIEVICDATTYLAFDMTDNRTDSVLTTGVNNFGLGLFGEDTKVGFYTVTMKNATVKADSEAEAKTALVKVGGATAAATGLLSNVSTTKTQWMSTTSAAAAGQIFAADFAIKPTLNGALKNSDGTAELNGHAVMNFSFGV